MQKNYAFSPNTLTTVKLSYANDLVLTNRALIAVCKLQMKLQEGIDPTLQMEN